MSAHGLTRNARWGVAGAPSRSLTSSLAANGLSNVGILAINFVTGILVFRMLGKEGRGDLAFLGTLAQLVGWLCALGINEGMTYVAARRPEDVPRVIGTSLALIAPIGLLGVGLGEGLLPLLAGDRSDAVVTAGRWFMLIVVLNVSYALLLASLSGSQDFIGLSLVQLVTPVTYIVGVVVLAITDHLTVATVLAAMAFSGATPVAVALLRLRRREGIGRPSAAIAKEATRYGIRVQGSLLGHLANARLDVLVMAPILSSGALGLYSVATNTSGILISVIGTLGQVVLPAAARLGTAEGFPLVARMMRGSMAAALVLALPLAALAPWLLPLVYGSDARGASTSLRILLLGIVFAIGARILESGLQAANRPLAASVGPIIGMVITIVGLLLTLRQFGIEGAAWTTTVAYLATWLYCLALLRLEPHFSLRQAFSLPGLAADVRTAARKMPSMLPGRLRRTG